VESRNRNVWIVVAAILVVLCCCALAAAAAAGLWFASARSSGNLPIEQGLLGTGREVVETSFNVGEAPTLDVENFAGSVTVQVGENGAIHVVATKRALSQAALQAVVVNMTQQGNGVVIRATNSNPLNNASVELVITVPGATSAGVSTGAGNVDLSGLGGDVKVNTGAGSVTLESLTGKIDASSGAGSIDVRDASGTATISTGAGSINYQGVPAGDCSFDSGTGSIKLTVPANLSVQVDLETGLGSIDVGFSVQGQVSRSQVKGVIGSGDQGSIYAHTGVGSIELRSQ
jgi:DUF4097 and DUF4098 domain-containing protein YvlB